MNTYEWVRERVLTELARLSHADSRDRDRGLAADSLGDLLEWAHLSQVDAEHVVDRLVAQAISDESWGVRESALNAISHAATAYTLPYALLAPLAGQAQVFEPRLLAYVLFSLAATHDERARCVVGEFLDHPDAGVREEAASAVEELDAVRARTRRSADARPGTNLSRPSFRRS